MPNPDEQMNSPKERPLLIFVDHPFSGVQSSGGYWSASMNADDTSSAWIVFFDDLDVDYGGKDVPYYAWWGC